MKIPALADPEAESQLLGCLFVDPTRWPEVEHLDEDAFTGDARQALWRALREAQATGGYFDATTVRSSLLDDPGAPGEAGSELTRIEESALSAVGLPSYLARVEALARRRGWLATGQKLIELASEENAPYDVVRQKLEAEAHRMLAAGAPRRAAVSIHEAYVAAMRDIQNERDGKGTAWLRSGVPALDKITGGFPVGEVTVLAGLTGKGKSALAWQAARNVAADGGAVLGFSLEMGGTAIARRLVSAHASLPTGEMPKQYDAMASTFLEFGRLAFDLPFWLYAETDVSIQEIRSRARAMNAKRRLALVVVDYVQLVLPSASAARQSREREVASITRGLKAMADELGCAVLALSQLNRESDKEQRKPRLSDLRESGAVEQDAGLVGFLWDPAPSDERRNEIPIQLVIAKNRHGPLGTGYMNFRPAFTRFDPGSEGGASIPPAPVEPKRGPGRPRKHPAAAPAPVLEMFPENARAAPPPEREPGEEG